MRRVGLLVVLSLSLLACSCPLLDITTDDASEDSTVTAISPTETPTEVATIVPACPVGWLEYADDLFDYRICYPSDATFTQSGVSGVPTQEVPEGMTPSEYMDQIQAQYGDRLCISIQWGNGYVNVSPPPNTEHQYAICGRTGVGVGTLNYGSENVTIQGDSYTSEGYEFIGDLIPCDVLDCHNETYVLFLPDGTRIEYSASPSDVATYADYLATTKPVLIQIVETYWQF